MKKLLTIIIAATLLISTLLTCSSCGALDALINGPALDLENAKDNLEDNGYIVTYNDDPSEVNVKETLYASYSDSAFTGADEYITITVYEDSKSASIAYDEYMLELEMQKKYYELEIEKYENILKKYEDDLKSSEIDYYEDKIKGVEEDIEELEEYVIGKSGNTVWVGTKDAIKDSKH